MIVTPTDEAANPCPPGKCESERLKEGMQGFPKSLEPVRFISEIVSQFLQRENSRFVRYPHPHVSGELRGRRSQQDTLFLARNKRIINRDLVCLSEVLSEIWFNK